jgi:hypothetical protein
MSRLNTILRVATALALFAGTGAAAQSGPRVVGSGENASVEYGRPSANVVGGALVRQVGSGESASTEVLAVTHANPGRPTRMIGSGESAELAFIESASTVMFTGAAAAR